jgi:hypothetical protein
MEPTSVVLFFLLYLLPAGIAGLLQWADEKDSKIQLSTKERIIKLYLIPLIPVGNWAVIVFAIMDYIS